jgi:hypothetical protein
VPVFEDLFDIIENVLGPILKPLADKFDGVSDSIGGITGVIKTVIDWIQKLIDKLNSIDLPSWLTPSSPTPLEIGIRGINDSLKELNTQGLSTFSSNINALPGSGISSSSVTNAPVYNLAVQSRRSSESIIQDFDLMQAAARGR